MSLRKDQCIGCRRLSSANILILELILKLLLALTCTLSPTLRPLCKVNMNYASIKAINNVRVVGDIYMFVGKQCPMQQTHLVQFYTRTHTHTHTTLLHIYTYMPHACRQ